METAKVSNTFGRLYMANKSRRVNNILVYTYECMVRFIYLYDHLKIKIIGRYIEYSIGQMGYTGTVLRNDCPLKILRC